MISIPIETLKQGAKAMLDDKSPAIMLLLRAVTKVIVKRSNAIASKHNDLLLWLSQQQGLNNKTVLADMKALQITGADIRQMIEEEINLET